MYLYMRTYTHANTYTYTCTQRTARKANMKFLLKHANSRHSANQMQPKNASNNNKSDFQLQTCKTMRMPCQNVLERVCCSLLLHFCSHVFRIFPESVSSPSCISTLHFEHFPKVKRGRSPVPEPQAADLKHMRTRIHTRHTYIHTYMHTYIDT